MPVGNSSDVREATGTKRPAKPNEASSPAKRPAFFPQGRELRLPALEPSHLPAPNAPEEEVQDWIEVRGAQPDSVNEDDASSTSSDEPLATRRGKRRQSRCASADDDDNTSKATFTSHSLQASILNTPLQRPYSVFKCKHHEHQDLGVLPSPNHLPQAPPPMKFYEMLTQCRARWKEGDYVPSADS